MRSDIRRRLSMARRALDFASMHPVTDTAFTVVVKRLDSAVARASFLGVQLSDSTTGERAALARRIELRRKIRREQLRQLVRIASLAAVTHPDLAGKFVLPYFSMPNKLFVFAARAMQADAQANRELLMPFGLGTSLIESLGTALDQLEAATERAHIGRAGHVGASAELGGLVREIRRDIDVIETFYLAEFPNDLALLAGWASARNVPGPFDHSDATPPETGGGEGNKAA